MFDPLVNMLKELLSTVEEQIVAAKKLDVELLAEATERRQDLLFELEVERANRIIEVSDDALDLKDQIDLADERLIAILETVVNITKKVRGDFNNNVYSKKGDFAE